MKRFKWLIYIIPSLGLLLLNLFCFRTFRPRELKALYIPLHEKYYLLAQRFYLSDSVDKSLEYIDSVITVQPFYSPAYYLKCLILLKENNLTEARDVLKKYLELDPFSPDGWATLSWIWFKLGRPDLGRRCMETANRLKAGFL